jgi:hypothetical protein
MNEAEREARKAAQDYRHLLVQETDLTEQITKTRNPERKWQLMKRLDVIKTEQLAAKGKMEFLQKRMIESPEPVPVSELPKIYVICTRHCEVGRALPAICVPLNDGVVAVCPECVREGKELQKTLGVTLEEVGVNLDHNQAKQPDP